MYSRKSVDYAQPATIQTLDFAVFRRKGEQTTELIIENEYTNQFLMRRGQNTLMSIMVIADLLCNNKNSARKNIKKVFSGFTVENVPKSQFIYQHENTLQQLLTIINSRCKSLSAVQDCLINYTITEFVFQCYGRKTISNFIENLKASQQQLYLHGNQSQILLDYKTQLRGQLLNFLALAMNLDVSIRYKDTGSQLENSYNQYYGDPNSESKIKILDSGEFYRASISFNDDTPKLLTSQKINVTRKKDQQSLDTTIEGGQPLTQIQSRSTNKDGTRCGRCKGKLCECDKNSKKDTASKAGNNNTSSSKSIFEGLMMNGPRRQTSNHQISMRPCTCGRTSCVCRR